jgi:uncharacterized CHY-type Zn-finger protein
MVVRPRRFETCNTEILTASHPNVDQMSNLVADFLINPVLRQARRLSGNTVPGVDPVTNHYTQDEVTAQHYEPTSDARERLDSELPVDNGNNFSGRPIVSSPIQEDGELEAELVANGGSGSAPGAIEPPNGLPLRLASYRSDRMSLDEDFSDNPSYGIPSRFQNASPMSTSFSSTSHTQRASTRNVSRRSTEDNIQPISLDNATRQRNGSLPEDDGMKALRRRIIDIQKMDITSEEKARLMHHLLTEGYSQSQAGLHAKLAPTMSSAVPLVNQERPTTPGSLSSFSFWRSTATDTTPESSPSKSERTFHLSQDDLKPTYAPEEPRLHASSESEDDDDTAPARLLGCRHYKRNVKLQCFTCAGWYTCRFCHDDVEDHILPRKETRNMLCMLCGSAQQASDICYHCGVRAAWYYCGICKLWDDDANKSIYHCADCGICRVGRGIGKDFIHCKVINEQSVINTRLTVL